MSDTEKKMTEQARPPAPAAAPMRVGNDGLYELRDQTDVLRVAKHLLQSGAVPQSLRSEQQVAMAVQSLNSLGLNPYAAIRQVAFVNGAMTLWGDLPLALARKTSLLEDFEEFRFCLGDDGTYRRQSFDNHNAHLETFGAVCRVKRLHQKTHEVIFTQADAKRAGLWGKTPTWRGHPARMMQMRARSQALKDVFSDGLAGVAIQEFDQEGVASAAPAAPATVGDNLPRTVLLGQFAELGIGPGDLADYLGHAPAACSAAETELLRSLVAALAAGDITWADALEARRQLPDDRRAAGPTTNKPHLPSVQTDLEAERGPPMVVPDMPAPHAARRPKTEQLLRHLRNPKKGPVPT